jgi:polysaccharide biosynthesis/export protein
MRIITHGSHYQKHPKKIFYWLLSTICLYISSCSTPANITYFKNVPDTLRQKMEQQQAEFSTPTIQPDDILTVTIQTFDAGSGAAINQSNAAMPTGAAGPAGGENQTNSVAGVSGYLVDKNGYVVLPLIGKVLAQGKTTDQIRDDIAKKAATFYVDPVVNVRFSNFKVTVLGEVARPSTYVMPSEKVSLLDAIGMAGDLTIYGKRENVMLIREENGKKEFVRFDLHDSNIFKSPYFYLKQGDVVYVEPNKSKVLSTDATQVRRIAIITSVLTLLVIIASRVNF